MASAKLPLVPVFCGAEVSEHILNDFLTQAYNSAEETACSYKLHVIDKAETNASEISPTLPPVSDLKRFVFDEHYPDAMRGKIPSVSVITDEVFIVLDSVTARSRTTCRLVWRYMARFHQTRSYFGPSLVALAAVRDGKTTMQQLQNAAAIDGSALVHIPSAPTPEIGALTPQQQNLLKLEQRKYEWTNSCQLRNGDVPVFCTAEISLHILNKFIGKTYSSFFSSKAEGPWISLIDTESISENFPRPTHEAFKSLPGLPFLGMPVAAIAEFVKKNFPGNGLHHTLFIVLDEHTNTEVDIDGRGEKGVSCIVVDISGTTLEERSADALRSKISANAKTNEGEAKGGSGLALARVPLFSVLCTCMAFDLGELDTDTIADIAATQLEGVDWGLGLPKDLADAANR